jgi:hypothetical protein
MIDSGLMGQLNHLSLNLSGNSFLHSYSQIFLPGSQRVFKGVPCLGCIHNSILVSMSSIKTSDEPDSYSIRSLVSAQIPEHPKIEQLINGSILDLF